MFDCFCFVEVAFYLEAGAAIVDFNFEVVGNLFDVAIELAAKVG